MKFFTHKFLFRKMNLGKKGFLHCRGRGQFLHIRQFLQVKLLVASLKHKVNEVSGNAKVTEVHIMRSTLTKLYCFITWFQK